MKKVIRLTESQLVSVIKKIISEQPSKGPKDVFDELSDGDMFYEGNFKIDEKSITLGNKKLDNLGADWTKVYNSEIKEEKISRIHKFGNKIFIEVDKSTKRNPKESKTIRFEIKNPQ